MFLDLLYSLAWRSDTRRWAMPAAPQRQGNCGEDLRIRDNQDIAHGSFIEDFHVRHDAGTARSLYILSDHRGNKRKHWEKTQK